MATDFRDGKTFPRRGRARMGDFLWLARVSDKARASAAGTFHDYIYPCPMDMGVFERWGITADEFETALREHDDDASLLEWLAARVSPAQAKAANRWLTEERSASLDRQDSEEGVTSQD
jgi:hypothetical protein